MYNLKWKKLAVATCLCTVLSSVILHSNAQSSGAVHGTVITEEHYPLAAVTVSLLSPADSMAVAATATDSSGKYSLPVSASGDYLLRFSIVSYETKYFGPFYFPGNIDVNEPVQILKPFASGLAIVSVTAKKSIVENLQGKTVYNIEPGINSTGSTALEILQKTCGLQIDNSNNIYLKGRNGVKIYVNGREMPLDNTSLLACLRTINSNDIISVEVITNPDASYDAGGSTAIINIRLKKNEKYGTNGDVSMGYIQGNTPKGNALLNLNYRGKKINAFGSLGGNLGKYQTGFNLYRIQLDTLYNQRTLYYNYDNGFNIKAGLDYTVNHKNLVGVMADYGYANTMYSSSANTPVYSDSGADFVHNVNSINHSPGNTINDNFNINYRYKDTTGTEINFDANYGFFKHSSNGYLPDFYYDKNGSFLYNITNWNYGFTGIDIYTAKLDLAHSLWSGKINCGAKISSVNTDNTYNFYNADQNEQPVEVLNLSSRFRYRENIKAAYLNYYHPLGKKWTIMAGARFEQTYSKGQLFKADSMGYNTTTTRHYDDLFPGMSLSWNASRNHNVSVSYNRRTDRPVYQDLNPFELKLDEFTYFKGNSFLQPQYASKITLSDKLYKIINADLFYSAVTNYAIQGSDTLKNEIYAQVRNIGKQKVIGFDINAVFTIAPWWHSYQSFWYYFQMFDVTVDRIKINTNIPIFGFTTTQSFALKHGYAAELSGWFNGKSSVGIIWKADPMGALDAGVKKSLLNTALTIKLSATDIFHTGILYPHGTFGGVTGIGSLVQETQTLRLSVSWRFGSSRVKAARIRQTGAENESGRIKNQ